MKIPVQEKYIDKLNKFNKLKSTLERIKFFQKELPLNYIEVAECTDTDMLTELAPFRFDIPEEDWEETNRWILDNYFKYSNNPDKISKYLMLPDLIDSFDFKLEEIPEVEAKQIFTAKEMKTIMDSFKKSLDGMWRPIETYSNSKYNANKKSFDDYINFNGLEPDLKCVNPSVNNTLSTINGVTLSKYYCELQNRYNSFNTDPIEFISDNDLKKKKNRVTKPQQILIAHYMGVLDPIRQLQIQEKQKAMLVSTMLNIDEENTEKYMRNIGNLKARTSTKANYEFLVDYFDQLGLNEQMNKCNAVLKKILGK